MPATLTSDTRKSPTVDAANSLGVTSRWTGLTAITSIAAISSRILRDPRSAVMAEPPAPAMRSAVATGDASRTIASTIAAPVADSAPSWRFNVPTCSAMTAPNGMAMSTLGSVHTLEMNQHWFKYSFHQCLTSHVRRSASSEIANKLPASRTRNWTFPITWLLHRHDGVGFFGGNALRGEAAVLPVDELALDLGLLGRQLVHADRPASPASEEPPDDRL